MTAGLGIFSQLQNQTFKSVKIQETQSHVQQLEDKSKRYFCLPNFVKQHVGDSRDSSPTSECAQILM